MFLGYFDHQKFQTNLFDQAPSEGASLIAFSPNVQRDAMRLQLKNIFLQRPALCPNLPILFVVCSDGACWTCVQHLDTRDMRAVLYLC